MAIGWSESEGRCKKHPVNRQSPGVCSSCLRERLGQLSSSKPLTKPTSPPSFSSSSYSSCSYSSASSPSSLKLRNREIKNQISSLISREGPLFLQAEKPLGRSRSVVASIKNRVRETKAVDGKKKGGFWSTLLRSTSKRRKDVALLRSKTVEKKPSSTWVFAGRK